MSDIAMSAPRATVTPIPVSEIAPWAIFAGLLLLVALYFLSTAGSVAQLLPPMAVHEFLHDGRHLLGFPCH